jgi:hypothetical protein
MLLGTLTSGIFRSTNAGQNWACMTDGLDFPVLGVNQIVADPNNSNYLLAVTGTQYIKGTIVKSIDGGINWDSINQELTNQPYWIAFHPTISGLVFASFDKEMMYSIDSGENWVAIPNITTHDNTHNYFFKTIVYEDHFLVTSKNPFSNDNFLYRGDFIISGGVLTTNWTDLTNSYSNSIHQLPRNFNFSNKVGNVSYLQVEVKDTLNNSYNNEVYKSIDNGLTYSLVINAADLPTTSFSHKNELIASINQPNTFYIGATKYMRKYNDNGTFVEILDNPNNVGHHDDYRSSHIINDSGKDRILFGNDGGISVVKDGTIANPMIESCYGDLSISLLHGFDVHEGTKKKLYAFQDHAQVARDSDGNDSHRMAGEGSTAMIQQTYPDSYVVESAYGALYDDDSSSHFITDYGIGSYLENYLGGYFFQYKHHPYRFLRGMGPTLFGDDSIQQKYGKVGMNRGVNIKEEKAIFESRKIGAVGACDNDIRFIYAAEGERIGAGEGDKLYRSTDDGVSFTGIGNPLVSLDNGSVTAPLLNTLLNEVIRAIAVHPFDGNTIYCGIGGTHSVNNSVVSERFRVIKSTNGGTSFVDYSEGLPGLPVERLLTVESDNELIFCGTSVGVYYRTKAMNSWKCFSNQLPKAQITGMKFDYCDNVLYVSTYGRGLWKTDVNIPVVNSYVQNITSNETWAEKKRVAHNVVVKTGNTLTITGEIMFDKNIRVTVEKGAKLRVLGGTLTNFCGDTWDGVYVQGDRNLPQEYVHQGYVYLSSNATIEHAKNAISYDGFSNAGGIIRASNSFFINNKRDVQFLSYHSNPNANNPTYEADNKSSFTNCLFEINDEYIDLNNNEPFPNVTLWDVNGVKFNSNNTFKDSRTNPIGERRIGINSIDAAYKIVNNNFIDLDYGIKAYENPDFYGSANGKHIKVDNSTFNSLRGIYFQGVAKSRVFKNEFITDNTGLTNSSSSLYGVYLDFCDHYEIEENKFTSNADLNGGFTWGVLVANHHGDDTEIYKNEFKGHPVGIEAIDQNKPATFTGTYNAGLEIICNEFENSLADIYVADGGNNNVPVKGISRYQGNVSNRLADNLFANNSPNIFLNYGNQNEDITYFHHPTSQNTRLYPNVHDVSVTPSEYNNNKTYIENCPTKIIGTPGPIGSLFVGKVVATENLSTALATYNDLIDGGKTAELEQEVEGTVDQDAYEHYQKLMDKAGELSEEVLLEVAKKEEGFTLAMIRNILVANPLSAKIKELNEILNNRNNQLPQYMRNQIRLGKTMLSTKEFLELEIKQYKLELNVIIQNGIELIAVDSTINDPKGVLLELLSNTGVLNYDMQRLKIHASNCNLDEMDEVKLTIENYKLTKPQIKYLEDIYKFVELKLVWKDKGYQLNQLPKEELDLLKDWAANNQLSAANAMGILALNNQLDYKEPTYVPELSKSYKLNTTVELMNPEEYLLIYPNPTKDFIAVRYSYLAPYYSMELTIVDFQGKTVYKQELIESEDEVIIGLKNISAGNYVLSIRADEQLIFSDKVIKK